MIKVDISCDPANILNPNETKIKSKKKENKALVKKKAKKVSKK